MKKILINTTLFVTMGIFLSGCTLSSINEEKLSTGLEQINTMEEIGEISIPEDVESLEKELELLEKPWKKSEKMTKKESKINNFKNEISKKNALADDSNLSKVNKKNNMYKEFDADRATTLAKKYTKATIITNKGEITVKFYNEDAPLTVGNFLMLAQDGFYKGVIFHRVISGFMIQGGDPTGTGSGGPGYTFDDEMNNHKIVRGTLAMANAGANTNGSQFFIVTAEKTPHLDGKHTAFGEVTDGMEVVDKIENVKTDFVDKPLENVIIEDIILSE